MSHLAPLGSVAIAQSFSGHPLHHVGQGLASENPRKRGMQAWICGTLTRPFLPYHFVFEFILLRMPEWQEKERVASGLLNRGLAQELEGDVHSHGDHPAFTYCVC